MMLSNTHASKDQQLTEIRAGHLLHNVCHIAWLVLSLCSFTADFMRGVVVSSLC